MNVTTATGQAARAEGGVDSLPPISIVCLGEIPWDTAWKRNQSMVYELSRLEPFHRVVFVNPRVIWLRQLLGGSGGWRQRLGKLRDLFPRRAYGKVWSVHLFRFMPMKRHFPFGARIEECILAMTIRVLRGRGPFVLMNNSPDFFSRQLLEGLMRQAVLSVYDLSDDFVEFYQDPEIRARFLESIEYSCRGSDLVLAVNEHVRAKYAHFNAETTVLTNGTNFENFARSSFRPVALLDRLKQGGKPILGHTGTINRVRLDYELLQQLLEARPDWHFVFVGSAEASFQALVASYENLHYVERVDYARLPDYVHYFDATIIPFRVNEHTRGNDLLKFNDYLAMGKPIVTTPTGGAERYEGLVRVAEGVQDFLGQVEAALAEPGDDPVRPLRRARAKENSWANRVGPLRESILERIATRLAQRRQ